MVIEVTKSDDRFSTLMKGFNLRWPPADKEASKIYVCQSEAEVHHALARAINDVKPLPKPDEAKGEEKRITVRSGGHCYEDFVSSNPGGVIIDVGLVSGLHQRVAVHTKGDPTEGTISLFKPLEAGHYHREDLKPGEYRYGFKLLAGTQNWNSAVELFKTSGKLIPGGSCYSVGAGGHICGGGYGLSSRLHGLTVDYLAAVDILIITGDKQSPTVEWVHANEHVNKDIYKFCRGGGGGNIGIITAYYFEPKTTSTLPFTKCYSELPKAPSEVAIMMLDIPWDTNFPEDTAGKADFEKFLHRYAQYFIDNDNKNSTWGLFTLLKIFPRSTGSIKLNLQYSEDKGSSDPSEAFAELHRFLDYLFKGLGLEPEKERNLEVRPVVYKPSESHSGGIVPGVIPLEAGSSEHHKKAPGGSYIMDWLDATQTFNGVPANQRSTYKSSYMKGDFDQAAINGLWGYFGVKQPRYKDTEEVRIDLSQTYVQIDSYGGKINRGKSDVQQGKLEVINNTSVFQRSSVMKLQYMAYWWDESEDGKYQNFLNDLYSEIHKRADGHSINQAGPFPYDLKNGKIVLNPIYEGCYINYPDVTMTDAYPARFPEKLEDYVRWEVLYYGLDIFMELVKFKKMYDSLNVFRHKMSVPFLEKALPDPGTLE